MDVNNEREQLIKLWKNFGSEVKPASEPNLKTLDQIAVNFAPGTFFYYVFDFANYETAYVHPNVKKMSGIDSDTFNLEKFIARVHPDDLSQVLKKEEYVSKFLLEYLQPEDMLNYKISYVVRIKKPDDNYYFNLHQAVALSITNTGSLAKVLCTETDISHLGNPPLNTISFIDLKGDKSYFNLDINHFDLEEKLFFESPLTKQEMNILTKISFGLKDSDIAEQMNISINTVRTHRKNIIRKENANNMVEVVASYIRRGYL